MSELYVQLRQDNEHRKTVQEVQLDGVRILVRAQYIARYDRWVASLFDTSENLLVGGIACVPGVDLLKPYKHLALPQGALFFLSSEREPPTFTTLDVTSRCIYREIDG